MRKRFQQRAYQAGLKPEEFWDCSISEVSLMIGGYEDRVTDEWRMTRRICYMIYCLGTDPKDRVTIDKWMPLEGDAIHAQATLSPKERLEAAKAKWEHLLPRTKQPTKKK